MKILIMSFAVSLISGCAIAPSTPKPHETKYAVQVLEVNSTTPFNQKLMNDPNEVEEILNNPNTRIYEYPILYAQTGEAVVEDQTKTVSMPEDYDVIDGKAVPKEKEVKLGRMVEVSVSSVQEDNITYKIDIHNQKLVGYDTIKAAEGIEVEMPCFKSRNLSSEITQPFGVWQCLGGLQGTQGNFFFCVRALPPSGAE
jgi:hypothetical protein